MSVFNIFKRKTKKVVAVRNVKEGYNNPDYIKPVIGSSVEIDCGNFGVRKAIYCDPKYLFVQWRLTDCTHPIQNMNMPDRYIQGWRELDKNGSVTENAEFYIVGNNQHLIQ